MKELAEFCGYVGVVNGKPVFEKFSDDNGDAEAMQVYKTQPQALERWAHVRRVCLILDPERIIQPVSRGRIRDR